MKQQDVGRALFWFGLALVGASAIRAMADLLQADPFDPWAGVLAAGCVLLSVGLGMKGQR